MVRRTQVTDPASVIWVHVIAAIPPTLAAVAALITAIRTRRNTEQIKVAVNGRLDRLQDELEAARRALAQKGYE